MELRHAPVMVEEVLEHLALPRGGRLLDLTLGGGGHTRMVLERDPTASVLGVDQDSETLAATTASLSEFGPRLRSVHARYDEWPEAEPGSVGEFDAVLMDLGISSIQLDDPTRGMSFDVDAELDMRMDRSRGETAARLLQRLPEKEIADLLFRWGDERRSRAIARRIVERRRSAPVRRTAELAELCVRVYGGRGRERIHPATRTFQALRMAVNDELGALEKALARVPDWLAPGGRLVVLSFHSGEDRVVKWNLREQEKLGRFELLTRKPLVPTAQEVERNRRARSAKLRAARRCGGG